MLNAFYDLSYFPDNYEIVQFLARSQLEADGEFRFVLVPPKVGGHYAKRAYRSREETEQRIANIILPATKLFKVKEVVILEKRYEYDKIEGEPFPKDFAPDRIPLKVYQWRHLKKYMLPPLVVPEHALKCADGWIKENCQLPPVVMTLREYRHHPERNSRIDQWVKFAQTIREGYTPVFVRDTRYAGQTLENYTSEKFVQCDIASLDLLFRAALYEKAYMNVSVGHGPLSLCWWNPKTRHVDFLSGYAPGWPTFIKNGFTVGENPKFCGPYQKWVWGDDSDYLKIYEEFYKMREKINHTG